MKYILAIAASALLVPFGVAQQAPSTTPNSSVNSGAYSSPQSTNTQTAQPGQSTTANPSINANQSAQPGSASPGSSMQHPAPLPQSNQPAQSGAVGSSTQQQQPSSMGQTGTATTAPQSGTAMSNSTQQNTAQATTGRNQQELQGCIVKRDNGYFLQPSNGGPEVQLNANDMKPFNRIMNNEEAQLFGHYGAGNQAGAAYNSQNSAKHEEGAVASNTGQAGVSGSAAITTGQSATGTQAGTTSAIGGQSTMSGSQSGTAATGTTAETTPQPAGATGQPGQVFQVSRAVSLSNQCTPGAGAQTTPR